jgi:hypothetical protein
MKDKVCESVVGDLLKWSFSCTDAGYKKKIIEMGR